MHLFKAGSFRILLAVDYIQPEHGIEYKGTKVKEGSFHVTGYAETRDGAVTMACGILQDVVMMDENVKHIHDFLEVKNIIIVGINDWKRYEQIGTCRYGFPTIESLKVLVLIERFDQNTYTENIYPV